MLGSHRLNPLRCQDLFCGLSRQLSGMVNRRAGLGIVVNALPRPPNGAGHNTMRSCIFCDDAASTKEDAWPLWLMRLLGETPPGRMDAERGRDEKWSWPLAKSALKVKFVCARCNNGWMSRLENRVKPIICALLSEDTITLDSGDQTTLAVWSLKNAMVLETLRPSRPWFYTKADRRELMDTLEPIQRTSIWITKCFGHLRTYCAASDLKGVAGQSGDQVEAYVTTMCFGPLAIQVLSTKLPNSILVGTTITADVRPGPWDSVTLQIWPPRQERVGWPPSVALSGEVGLLTFGERWSPK